MGNSNKRSPASGRPSGIRNNDPGLYAESFDQIVDEFVLRLRNGDHPSIEAYRLAFPQHAADIAELFPTLVTLEKNDPVRDVPLVESGPMIFETPTRLGKYIVKREIGRGGMGVVYEAEHETMRRRVALKVLPGGIQNPDSVKRFIREARAAGQLHHTNIVPIFEVGECEGVHYYSMQYIFGQNLDAVIGELQRLHQSGYPANDVTRIRIGTSEDVTVSRIPVNGHPRENECHDCGSPGIQPIGKAESDATATQNHADESTSVSNGDPGGSSQWTQIGQAGDSYFRRVARVGVQIAEALQYAHDRGLLHRDIKPSNLILDTDGVVWITDFGLAKDSGDDLTHTGDIVGTLRYMAPERFRGHADARSDVYSLGLTLYELCTLRYAFDQSDRARLVHQITSQEPVAPRRIRPQIPRDLETVIVKAIAREPSRRYTSAAQMAADLHRFISDRPVLARRISLPEKLYRWARRNPTRAALVSCLILIAVIITFGSMYLANLKNRHANELRKENESVLRQKTLVDKALKKADAALARAESANLASRAHLYDVSLGQAEAMNSSGKQGQRFESLRLVQKAADIVPALRLPPDKMERRHFALRNAAIAAMAQWDVDTEYSWTVDKDWTNEIGVDFTNHRIAQRDTRGNIAVRSLDRREIEFRLPSPGQQAWILRFSPDGKYLAARYHHPISAENPIVCLWDVTAEKERFRIDGVAIGAAHCFSPDNALLAVLRNGNSISVFSTSTGELALEVRTASQPLHFDFAENGRQLIVTEAGKQTIDFWNLTATPALVDSIPVDTGGAEITALAWNEHRNQLAVAAGRDLLVWPDKLTGEPIRLSQHQRRIVKIGLHPGGMIVATTSWDGTSRLFDLVTRQEVVRMDGCRLTYDCIDDTGVRMAFMRNTNEYGIWRLPEDLLLNTLITENEAGSRCSAAFVPGHPDLIAYPTIRGVEIWHHPTQRLVVLIPGTDTRSVQFNSDSSRLYAGSPSGLMRWNLEIERSGPSYRISWAEAQLMFDGDAAQFDVHFEKQCLAVRKTRNYVTVVNMDTRESRDFGPHPALSRFKFTPDGHCLVTATWQGFGIKVWDLDTGRMLKDLAPRTSTASIAINPSSNTMAAVSGESLLQCSIVDWQEISARHREQPDGWAGDAAFSGDGQLLATTFSRYVAQLLDTRTGKTVATLIAPAKCTVGSMAWSDDGRFLSISDEKTIQIWNVAKIREQLRDLGINWHD